MKDEEYLYKTDCREKKNIANSARNKRTHTGKGGRVRFPSDYLTKKEKEAMNGEVKSYKLNAPMSYEEFKAMPKDIQEQYLKLLRKVYCAPWTEIEAMMGCGRCVLSRYMERNGIHGGERLERNSFQKEKWLAFVNRVPKPVVETPVEEIPVEETPVEEIPVVAEVEEVIETPNVEVLPMYDFKEECDRLREENRALMHQNEKLRYELNEMETEMAVLRGQIDIVRLIFGGK
jgi:hypothetical protein